MQIVTLGIVGALFYFWQRPYFVIDTRNIAENMTMQLLVDYQRELHLLNEKEVKQYVREKYVALCQELGLPLSATEKISSLVWGAIHTARGEVEPESVPPKFSFYD